MAVMTHLMQSSGNRMMLGCTVAMHCNRHRRCAECSRGSVWVVSSLMEHWTYILQLSDVGRNLDVGVRDDVL